MLKEESNITRKALLNETFMGLKGLRHKCKELTKMMGIPDIMINLVMTDDQVQHPGRRQTVGGYTGQHLPEVHVTTKQQDMDEAQSKIHQRSKGK